jgi:hypothetical protein
VVVVSDCVFSSIDIYILSQKNKIQYMILNIHIKVWLKMNNQEPNKIVQTYCFLSD